MSEDSSAAGAEHLQNAARELISAARLFLDAASEVVEDPEVISDLAGSFRGIVGDLATGRKNWAEQPGEGWPFEEAGDRSEGQDPAATYDDSHEVDDDMADSTVVDLRATRSRVRRIEVE